MRAAAGDAGSGMETEIRCAGGNSGLGPERFRVREGAGVPAENWTPGNPIFDCVVAICT